MATFLLLQRCVKGALVSALCLAAIGAKSSTPGTVVGWGWNDHGESTAPADLDNVTAVAAGWHHSVALKSAGVVVAWGDNTSRQTAVPADLGTVVSIAAGGTHTVALRSDGTVAAWGRNNFGQTNVPVGLTGITAIAAGAHHTVALKSDGTVTAWGRNLEGQSTIPAGLAGVVAVTACYYYTVALKNDGTVVRWGSGSGPVPTGLGGVVAIVAGGNHTLALRNDGTVMAWGDDGYGQATVPVGLTGVTAIAAGDFHSVAVKGDGTVVAWGRNFNGQTTVPTGLRNVTAIAAGARHNIAIGVTPPSITTQPVNLAVIVNSNVNLSATTTGTSPFIYQWLKNGALLAGQTNSQLALSTLTNRASGGSFSVVVSNLYGAATGNVGSLRVRVPHRLLPPVQTNGVLRLLSTDQDGGLLTTNDLPYFVVQSGTNFASPNWVSFSYTNGLLLTNGMLRLDDTNAATRPVRFYRVLEQ